MTQYLLSIYQPDGETPPPEFLAKVMRDVYALLDEAKSAGVWVFNGGLHPPTTATVLRFQRDEVLMTDGPTPRAKSTSAGSWSSRPQISTSRSSGAASSRACCRRLRSRSDHSGKRRRADRCRATRRTRSNVFRGSTTARWSSSVLPRYRSCGRSRSGCVHRGAAAMAVRRSTPNPAARIITTARNRAIDRLRREASREDRHAQAAQLRRGEPSDGEEEGDVQDDRLRLIFTCCHPTLATEAQVALTLRLIGGLTTAEIARAFLVPEPTMAQRLVRAKGRFATRESPIGSRVKPICRLAFAPFSRSSI